MKTQLPTVTIQLNPNVTTDKLGAIAALLMSRPEVIGVTMPVDLKQRAQRETTRDEWMGAVSA